MVIVVTGGAGFIGSSLVRALAADGADVLVVDVLDHPGKVANLSGTDIVDLVAPDVFHRVAHALPEVTAVLHQGARTSTLDDDGAAVMAANYDWSKVLLDWTTRRRVPLVYASSAAVYGTSTTFDEEAGAERSLNVYAYSKQLFDAWVRRHRTASDPQVVGLRYFNVYGPGEDHKGPMRSVVAQFDDQLAADGAVRVFGAGCGVGAGEHRRDFVHVDDVVSVVRWFLDRPDRSGIFNCGTGAARSFAEVAALVTGTRGHGAVEYVEFPPALQARYQASTQADLKRLRDAGYDAPFVPIEVGVPDYLARREPS